jgi:hypothetical protein
MEALEDLESNRKKMLDAQIALINHAITRKHVFERWKKVANFMIFKEPGSYCTPYPIYGNGQGSGNRPPVWGMISTKLLNAHESKAHGATFVRPDRSQRTKLSMRGFIDDKNSTVNRFEGTNQSHTEIMPLVQHDAQLWNDLLDCSGGALEASKCVFHIAEYGFTPAGKPFYKHVQQNPPSIQIQTNKTKIPVSLLPPEKHWDVTSRLRAGKPQHTKPSPKTPRQNQPKCLQADSHLSAPTDTFAESSFLASHTPFQSILFLRTNWQSFKVKPTDVSSLS